MIRNPQALTVAVAEWIGDSETVDDIRCHAHKIAHSINLRTDLHTDPDEVCQVARAAIQFKATDRL